MSTETKKESKSDQDLIGALSRYRKRVDVIPQSMHQDERMHTVQGYHAVQSALLAKGWAGKAMKYLGADSPYKEVKEIMNIPDPADVAEKRMPLEDATYLDALYEVKRYADGLIDDIEAFQSVMITRDISPHVNFCIEGVWRHLHECTMHIGFAIAELKKEYLEDS